MNIIDTVKRKGSLSAYLVDPAWKDKFPTRIDQSKWPVKEHLFTKHNTMLNAGRLRANKVGYKFNHIAGGIGTSTTEVTDTALQNEIQRFNVIDTVYSLGQIDVFSEIESGTGNITWYEWGVLMDDSLITRGTGTLFARILHEFHKNLGETILLAYRIQETI